MKKVDRIEAKVWRTTARPKSPSIFYLLFSILFFLTGCRTAAPFPTVDFSQPGWKIETGQAVWKPNKAAPEIAGELLVGRKSDSSTVVQFTKTPFPFVVAQTTPTTWQLEIPAQNKTYSGHGKPPKRAGWLYLADALEGTAPPAPWNFERNTDDSWQLKNGKSGEVIEGFVNP